MKKTRILLADDHALVRAGIRALLEKQNDMEIVGEAADGQEALDKVAELQPDVIVMDIAMPGMGGMEATKRIKSQYPHVQVLALTMLDDERYFFEIIQAGASGFIVKGALPAELLVAVRAVADGNVYLYPTVAKNLVGEYLSEANGNGAAVVADELTDREQQILQMISQGRTGKEIAGRLEISARTVDRHRENVMAKLNLHSRAALVKYAVRKGLIDNDT
jgi:two-component system, NarL family, response regulator NreC